MSRNLTAAGCSSGEHVAACQCDVCLLRSELAEARSMHQDTLRAFEKYEKTSRAEHAAALEEIDDILSSFGQLGRELLTYAQIADGTKHSEAVPRPADEIVYKALRRVRSLKASISGQTDARAIVARIEKATKGTT